MNKVVPEKELESAVEEIVARISAFSTPVLEMTKAAIAGSAGLPLQAAMKRSKDIYLNQLMCLEDAQEGLRARVEQRPPVWKNR